MFILLTPAHNERDNAAALAACVRASTLAPDRWIVVDDRSTDGTSEAFEAEADLPIEVVPSGTTGGYMGFRYSEVILAGVRALGGAEVDLLGILDCDIRFGPDYWARLAEALTTSPRLGIVSGALAAPDDDGGWTLEPQQRVDLPRGGLRLCTGDCWRAVGWSRARAPDSHMTARAKMRGYQTALLPDVVAWSVRPTDSRGDSEAEQWASRGRRAFEAGQPGWQVALRALGGLRRGRVRAGAGLLKGYLDERREGEATGDDEVRRYYARERPKEWLRSVRAKVSGRTDPHRTLPSRPVAGPPAA